MSDDVHTLSEDTHGGRFSELTGQRSLAASTASVASAGSALLRLHPWHWLTAALLALDGIAITVAFALAFIIRFKAGIPFLETPPHSLAFYSSLAFWAVPVWLVLFILYHLYDRHHLFVGFQEYILLVHACTSGMLVIIVISFLDITLYVSRGWLLLVWALAIICVGSLRFGVRRLVRRVRTDGFFTTATVIVGANEEGRALAEQFVGDPGSGIRIVGFVDSTVPRGTSMVGELAVLGNLQDVEMLVRDRVVSRIVVATTALTRDELLDLYRTFGRIEDVEIQLSSGLFEILTTGVRVQEISHVPLMSLQRVRITGIDATLKALLDYVGAVLGLLFLSPVLVVVALLVKLDSPGPVLHCRRVLGRSGKPFEAFKFRTMVVNADEIMAGNAEMRQAFESGYKLRVDPRVTRFGHFLRRTSLDELPQLINVLRGEMSLVGPRMIAPEEAQRYSKWQLNLLTVKPGITGPWQVYGRNNLPYEERVRLNMNYIRNYSIWLDLEILVRTIPTVLQGTGAY